MCQGAMMDGGIRSLAPCTTQVITCELCDARALLYCEADGAYLCRKCDEWVHGANFLAKRHVRCVLCKTCQKLTQRYHVGASADEASRGPEPELSKCERDKRTFLFLRSLRS